MNMDSTKTVVKDILKKAGGITQALLQDLEQKYNITFEVISLPNFGIHPIDRYPERIRLFEYDGKIFL